MTNPRCVLCGDEFEIETEVCMGVTLYQVRHDCYISSLDGKDVEEYEFNFTGKAQISKADSLATIPKRFLKKENEK